MDSPTETVITYDYIPAGEVKAAYQIEIDGFPQDEAATLEAFQYRQEQAPELFLGAYTRPSPDHRVLIAFVCATLSPSPLITHESMSRHIPSSPSVCIHSVCVTRAYRRDGVGLCLLKEYFRRLEAKGVYERALVIVHEELRGFYEKAGFEWLGKSKVQHGARPWFEMRKILGTVGPPPKVQEAAPSQTEPAATIPQAMPAGLLEALQRGSRDRPSRLLSTFPNGVSDVTMPSSSNDTATNKHDLLCPKPGCGSIILKSGVATYVMRPSVQLEPPDSLVNQHLPLLPAPPLPCACWLITPSPMAFENIGFSQPVPASSHDTETPKLRLLACAECDLGPLGWHQSGTEYWLACARVGYRVQ